MIEARQGSAGLLRFDFPLLNRGDFFVVKILLSGALSRGSQVFTVLADDLPRTIRPAPAPTEALTGSERRVEWGAAAAGAVILSIALWLWYLMYLVYQSRPEWFPYPWHSFVPSIQAVIVGVPGLLVAGIFTLLSLMALAAAPFGGAFPPRKGPRFPLPPDVLRGIGRYWGPHFHVREGKVFETHDRSHDSSSDDSA